MADFLNVLLSSGAGIKGEAGDSPYGGIEALLQQAIGTAVLEKLNGANEPPSGIYVSKGGQDAPTLTILKQLDDVWHKTGELFAEAFDHIHKAEKGTFSQLYDRLSGSELALVERTIGQGFLDGAAGKHSDLLTIYQALGGQNPTTTAIFQQFHEPFGAFKPTLATDAFSELFASK